MAGLLDILQALVAESISVTLVHKSASKLLCGLDGRIQQVHITEIGRGEMYIGN